MPLLTCQWTRYPYYLLLFGTKLLWFTAFCIGRSSWYPCGKFRLGCKREPNFSILWLHMCSPKKRSRKSKILHPESPVTFGCNRSQIQSGSGFSLICWKRPRMCFEGFPLPRPMSCQLKNGLVFHQEWASCTGDWYTHELKTFRVELSQLTTR